MAESIDKIIRVQNKITNFKKNFFIRNITEIYVLTSHTSIDCTTRSDQSNRLYCGATVVLCGSIPRITPVKVSVIHLGTIVVEGHYVEYVFQ